MDRKSLNYFRGFRSRVSSYCSKIIIKRFSVHFWTFKIFFKTRGLVFETSDSDFRDLLNELFHMNQKIFLKKTKILKSYFEVPNHRF